MCKCEIVEMWKIKYSLLHFERNYFTGVNRLTPQTELLHTSKNEVKVIPSLPAQSWKTRLTPSNFSQWREGNNQYIYI